MLCATHVDEDAAPLLGGYYSIQDAGRILKIRQEQAIRAWAFGQAGRSKPVIARQYPKSRSDIGFLDLIEIRFIHHFRSKGVSLQSIRRAAIEAREILESLHPFALNATCFKTDRRRIFLQAAKEEGDDLLYDLVTGQYAMYDIMEASLSDGLTFDPESELACSWRPDARAFPDVVLTPRVAFGAPSLVDYNVPTAALFDAVCAEGGDSATVADWYEVPVETVRQAVRYETQLRS